MTKLDHKAFRAMGKEMAAMNGYRPMQSSGLYPTSGDEIDWMYGAPADLLVHVRDVPRQQRLSPALERRTLVSARRTHRSGDEAQLEAVLYLVEQADCPYRATGMAAEYCGPFFDDLEISRGWTVDANGMDTASDGTWSRGTARSSTFQLPSLVRRG